MHSKVSTDCRCKPLNSAEINRIGMSSQQGGGGGGGHKKKSLMDPKNFELKYLDGDKETKNAIDEWRDDMEEYLNSFFPNLKFFMEKAARWKTEIDEE